MKTLKMTIPVLTILVAGLFFTGCASKKALVGSDGYTIKYQLKEGEKFTVTGSSITSTEMDQMGQIITSDIIGKSVDNFIVLSSDENTGNTIEQEFVERKQDIESVQVSTSTDFSELAGHKIKFILKGTGDVDKIEGLDKLPSITTIDGTVLTGDTYKLGIEASFISLPENAIKIGDSWLNDQDTEVPVGDYKLKVSGKTSYTLLEEVKKDGFDCLKISIDGVSTLSGSFEQQGMELSMNRETKTTGTLYFAYKKGMFLSIESEAKAEGIIVVESMGMEIPQTTVTKSNVTVKFK